MRKHEERKRRMDDEFLADETSSVVKPISPFVRMLREDTRSIISVNPCSVCVMREVFKNEDDEEDEQMERRVVSNEWVRLSQTITSPSSYLKPNEATIQYCKTYHLTALYDANIKKGDLLINENKEIFKVQEINTLYAQGLLPSNRYRKVAICLSLEE